MTYPLDLPAPVPLMLRRLLQHRRPLLLQGPMGPFFARLAAWLEQQGAKPYKVNFNGGDQWFYRRARAYAYRGRHEDLDAWLASFVVLHRIDALVLFGQHRPVHELARAVAARLSLPVFVFEEGYLRPDYITLEEGGVNGLSSVPKSAEALRFMPDEPPASRPQPVAASFARMAWYATCYSVAMWVARPVFAHHVYHRPLHPLTQALAWLRGGWRKLWHGWTQRDVWARLCAQERHKRYFVLPLQVHNDSQMQHYSPYPSVEAVIDEVMASFARHAPVDEWLVIKHHPMDRAYRCYARHIAQRQRQWGLQDRVLYVHDVHLPTLLRHARGVVTVNSTVGLQALYHKVPVLTLGACFYAIDGLVHAGPLARFWREPGRVDEALYQRLRHYLLRTNQINGSFYGRLPGLPQGPVAVPDTEEATQWPSVISQPVPLEAAEGGAAPGWRALPMQVVASPQIGATVAEAQARASARASARQ